MDLRVRNINGNKYVGDARIYHRNLNHAQQKAQALRRFGLNVRTVKYRPSNPIFVNLFSPSYNRKKGRFDGVEDLPLDEKRKGFPQKDPFFVRKIPARIIDDLWRGPLGTANFSWGPPLKKNELYSDFADVQASIGSERVILYPGQLQGKAKNLNEQSVKDYLNSISELYGDKLVPIEDTMHRFLDRGPYIDAMGDLYPIIAYSEDGELPSESLHASYYDPQTYLIRQTVPEGSEDDSVVISTAKGELNYRTRGNHGNLHYFCGDQEPTLNQQQVQTLSSNFGQTRNWPYDEKIIEDILREVAHKAKKHLLRCPHCANANPGYVEAYSIAGRTISNDNPNWIDDGLNLEPDPYAGSWFPYDNLQFPHAWGQSQNPRYDEWLRLIRNLDGVLVSIQQPRYAQSISYLDGLLIDAKNSAQSAELETREIDETVMDYLKENDLKDIVPYREITKKPDPFRRIDDI